MIYKNIDLEKLLELMDRYETAEICLRDGKTSVEVKRMERRQGIMQDSLQSPQNLHKEILISTNTPPQQPPPAKEKVTAPDDHTDHIEDISKDSNIKEINAPLVGTFYRSPAPNASPYVEVGDKIKAGDTLCIVEAMKNMNEIESDIDGTITEICIQNAELVEYGQILFRIDTSG